MKCDVGYNIYTPAEYEKGERRYPVAYWLHGLGGNENGNAFVSRYVDRAIEAGEVAPMLMVFVNGGRASMYSDSVDGTIRSETAIIKELIPHIDKSYRTIASRDGRAIQGMSMGGFGALKLACKFPELFRSCLSYGGALHNVETLSTRRTNIFERMFDGDRAAFQADSPYELAKKNADRIRGKLRIRMVIGTADQTGEYNRQFHALLDELKIPHAYVVVDDVRHNLRQYLEADGGRGFAFAAEAFAGRAGE
jgi:endo-1,4-beta-xylanase